MNLLSKLHKNSILTGPIESYCLVCRCYLRSEEESYAHIQDPTHVDKLNAVPRLADYNDSVIKSQAGYFCRYCNIIIPTIKRVSLHVKESTHIENKKSQLITRHAGVILACDSVVIDERAWNGLDGFTCSVCNEDYDDEENHRRSPTHVLNLIQIACEFGDNYIYRKVDDVLFFCLICNELLPLLEKATHHETEKHLTLYEKSKIENTDIQTKKVIESNNNKSSIELNNNSVNEAQSIQLTQNAEDNKPKELEKKTQYGSAEVVNDCKDRTPSNLPEPTSLNVNENKVENKTTVTEKVLIPEPKSEPQINKTQELDKTVPLNTLAKDTEPNTSEATKKADNFEPVTNGDTVATTKGTYLYEFLKNNNFVVKSTDGFAYCAICDIRTDEKNINAHTLDSHHKILYAKHVAKKNAELITVKTESNREPEGSKQVKVQKTVSDKSERIEKELKEQIVPELTNSYCEEVKNITQNEPQQVPVNNQTNEFTDVVKLGNDKGQNKADNIEKECKKNYESNEKNGTEIQKGSVEKDQSSHGNKLQPIEPLSVPTKGSKKASKKAAKAKFEAEPSIKDNTDNNTIKIKVFPPKTSENQTGQKYTSGNTIVVERVDNDNTNHALETNSTETVVASKTMDSNITCDTELKTERLLTFLKTISQVDNPKDVVINNKYVLGNYSFVLVMRTAVMCECYACDGHFTLDYIQRHINSDQHKMNVEECLIVTSLDDEFIRQVKTQEYHCGYCNMVLPDWEAMTNHLNSYQHCDAKTSAAWRLQRYQSYLKNCETREVRSVLTAIFRCTRE